MKEFMLPSLQSRPRKLSPARPGTQDQKPGLKKRWDAPVCRTVATVRLLTGNESGPISDGITVTS